jgi:hypothetical protein
MNKGIEILLERMKTNPEDFRTKRNLEVSNRWENLVYQYEDILEKEDVEKFKQAIRKLKQEFFTEDVMKELLNPKSEGNPYTVTGTTLGGLSGVTLSPYSNVATTATLTLGNQTLDEKTLKDMKAQLDAVVKHQKQQTMFGKLYNYLGMNK